VGGTNLTVNAVDVSLVFLARALFFEKTAKRSIGIVIGTITMTMIPASFNRSPTCCSDVSQMVRKQCPSADDDHVWYVLIGQEQYHELVASWLLHKGLIVVQTGHETCWHNASSRGFCLSILRTFALLLLFSFALFFFAARDIISLVLALFDGVGLLPRMKQTLYSSRSQDSAKSSY